MVHLNIHRIVQVQINEKPLTFSLSQNYPNPFNPSTVINFQIAERTNVTLKVYNILGKEIAVLLNEVKDAGDYKINFKASSLGGGLASGVYIYELSTAADRPFQGK